MKPLITALAICLLMVFCAPAQAQATKTWDGGGGDNNWSTGDNWDPPFDGTEPVANDNIVLDGANDVGDDTAVYDAGAGATTFGTLVLGGSFIFDVDTDTTPDLNFTAISLSGTTGPVTVQGDSPWEGDSLTIDSNTPGAARKLTKAGTGSFTVTGTTTLDGDATDVSTNYDATLEFDAGTLDPGVLVLDGGEPSETYHGQAVFDYDAGTLTNPDTVTFRGDGKIDAELDIIVDGTVTAEATTNAYETEATIDMLTDKTMYAERLTLTAGTDAGDTIEFIVTSGTGKFQTW